MCPTYCGPELRDDDGASFDSVYDRVFPSCCELWFLLLRILLSDWFHLFSIKLGRFVETVYQKL